MKEKDGIRLLTQMGFSGEGSKFQLTISDITDPKKPKIIGSVKKINKSLFAKHAKKVEKGRKFELKLIEFFQDNETCITTRKLST